MPKHEHARVRMVTAAEYLTAKPLSVVGSLDLRLRAISRDAAQEGAIGHTYLI